MTAAGAKGQAEAIELSRAERSVARRAAEIRATVPHLELTAVAEAGAALAACEREGVSFLAAAVRASALALRDVPRANGSHRGDTIEVYSRVNIGVTLSEEAFYAIPTVFDADAKSRPEIEGELRGLRERAQLGELRAPELAGATFTVSNPGEHGVLSSRPLVLPPQAAALAVGAVDHGRVTLELACDHRILYGAVAARFLNSIRQHLEQGAP